MASGQPRAAGCTTEFRSGTGSKPFQAPHAGHDRWSGGVRLVCTPPRYERCHAPLGASIEWKVCEGTTSKLTQLSAPSRVPSFDCFGKCMLFLPSTRTLPELCVCGSYTCIYAELSKTHPSGCLLCVACNRRAFSDRVHHHRTECKHPHECSARDARPYAPLRRSSRDNAPGWHCRPRAAQIDSIRNPRRCA